MPSYDLKCDKCEHEFNLMARMKDREEKKIGCPECGNKELSAVFKSVNIISSKKEMANKCPDYNACGGCCKQ
jgi:putative FmdB family regulatory protein